MNRQPQQQCVLCGRVEIVKPDGRGFPPDIAKRRLVKNCRARGCPCNPKYTAGFAFDSVALEAVTEQMQMKRLFDQEDQS